MSFADACVRAARELCDTPQCRVRLLDIDRLGGIAEQHRSVSILVEDEREANPTEPDPAWAAAAWADRGGEPPATHFEIRIRSHPPTGRRRVVSPGEDNGGLLLFPEANLPRPNRSHSSRLEFISRWGSTSRPIEVTAHGAPSQVDACRAAVNTLDEERDLTSIEGPLVIEGLRPPAPGQPWKGTPEIIAERFRTSNVADGGDTRAECTVHAYVWSVASTRTVGLDDIPEDFTGTLAHESDRELRRLAAYCLEGIDDAPRSQTLVFASGSRDAVTCATGERVRRTTRAVSRQSRGDACAEATEQLCEGDACLIEVGGIVVAEDRLFRTAVTNAFDHRVVVQGVGHNQTFWKHRGQSRQGRPVGDVARRKQKCCLLAMQVGQLTFQQHVIMIGA